MLYVRITHESMNIRPIICLIRFQLDTALLDAYEYMQKYAVGLEQIVWDQEELNLEFHKEFQDTEYELRTVSLFSRSSPLSSRVIAPSPRVFNLSLFYGAWNEKGRERKKKNRCARDFHNSSGAISLNYSFSCGCDKKRFAKLYERFT